VQHRKCRGEEINRPSDTKFRLSHTLNSSSSFTSPTFSISLSLLLLLFLAKNLQRLAAAIAPVAGRTQKARGPGGGEPRSRENPAGEGGPRRDTVRAKERQREREGEGGGEEPSG